ncbi:hypothetical protein Ccrd_021634 [Cynara cardunculus var. scolymus]|uniref:Fatty acid hydroxylase domain-containing protein n=1 Tax=Cynara cardunculus var. scolymus TaxID=59895 RepID=A0A103Y0D7_CYNCS|nr:hypothetical protein Ccrd_021634 [Cynara cardunculus var. scolymus]
MCMQMYVSMKAMPWYCALPTISEYMIENGWTRCFLRISDVGWVSYAWNVALYLAFVEFGMALNPLDGILQALPHVVVLFVVPTHFATHIGLVFLEAIWTTNIHDCIHGKRWPIMGAGYHTIHHTTCRHNYGHYTVWIDQMFGTLCNPEKEDDGKKS